MPELEDVIGVDDSYVNANSEEDEHRLDSIRDMRLETESSSRMAIRRAIEARREQRRIARDLDSIESDVDNL